MIENIAIDKINTGNPKNSISSSVSMVAFMVLVFIGSNLVYSNLVEID